MNLYEDALITVEIAKGAGDNETLTGIGVDMRGYDSVCFIATCAEGEALALSLKAQQDIVSTFASAADLAGSAVGFTPSVSLDAVAVLDIHNVQERYVRAALVAPNFTTARGVSVIAIRYNAESLPVSGNSSYGEMKVGPAEGTA